MFLLPCLLFLPLVAAIPAVDVALATIGHPTSNDVLRYSLKYATANRWASPTISTALIPSNLSHPTALPLPCPQADLDPSQLSEDCLDLVLYVPPTAKYTQGGVPTIVWVHGGSFIVGSATGPGLDASNLAVGTNAIVAVVQYRLGVLGLLPPSPSSSTGNLAIQDLITALRFLHQFLPSLGGTPHAPHLTLSGQSSGASLVRALLGIPEAATLFSSAWLHSDPLDFGFLTPSAAKTLRNAWLTELGCASNDGCAQDMALTTLLSHQSALLNTAPTLGPEFFAFAPIRPSGEFIAHRLTSLEELPAPSARKPVVVSTVHDEATPVIYSTFSGPLPPESFEPIVAASLGPNRSASVFATQFYPTNSSDARVPLQILGTDEIWRCAAWRLARQWSPAHAYVGVFTRGVTYPGNDVCTTLGAVCHQDDIMVLFGTGGQDSADIRVLTREMQSRYAAFVRSGSPNASGLTTWYPAGAQDVSAYNLGGSDVDNDSTGFPVGACQLDFWGEKVPFDYQILGE